MNIKLDMVGIVTTQFSKLLSFYKDVLGLTLTFEMEKYVEFESGNIRFAITTNELMHETTKHPDYKKARQGQTFELAFLVPSPQEVDSTYQTLIAKGATAVTAPRDMPWKQRAAFFADPDGNIHEIFANL